jgi:hypothetical protein
MPKSINQRAKRGTERRRLQHQTYSLPWELGSRKPTNSGMNTYAAGVLENRWTVKKLAAMCQGSFAGCGRIRFATGPWWLLVV